MSVCYISESKQPKKVCQLYCHAYGTSAYYKLSSKVEDGTKCSEDTSNICVDGQCIVSLQYIFKLKIVKVWKQSVLSFHRVIFIDFITGFKCLYDWNMVNARISPKRICLYKRTLKNASDNAFLLLFYSSTTASFVILLQYWTRSVPKVFLVYF